MATVARRDGDHYLLSGRKLFIPNGPIADVILVYAKTAPERGPKGISAFLVEKGFPGFSVAQKLIKMGCRGSPTGELLFDECRVPVENRIGPENAGVVVLMSGLDLERAVAAAISVGTAERLLKLSLGHARERRHFGRPIAEFQMIQAKLADMYVGLESMKLLAYRALALQIPCHAVNKCPDAAAARARMTESIVRIGQPRKPCGGISPKLTRSVLSSASGTSGDQIRSRLCATSASARNVRAKRQPELRPPHRSTGSQ